MDQPTMLPPYRVAPDIDVLPSYIPIPGLGLLPANAFLIKAREPVLVDAGLSMLQTEFRAALEALIDPADLRWLWLTHTDQDHTGSLDWLVKAAPEAQVVTTFLGVGKMGLLNPLPLDRCCWVNPGESLDVGDRELRAVRPPTFDAPETTGLFDPSSRAYFSSDCFGALLTGPAESATDVVASELEEGLVLWATIDTPWLHAVSPAALDESLEKVRRLDADMVLSGHLPPAHGLTVELLDVLSKAPGAEPWTGPGQPVLEQLLASTPS